MTQGERGSNRDADPVPPASAMRPARGGARSPAGVAELGGHLAETRRGERSADNDLGQQDRETCARPPTGRCRKQASVAGQDSSAPDPSRAVAVAPPPAPRHLGGDGHRRACWVRWMKTSSRSGWPRRTLCRCAELLDGTAVPGRRRARPRPGRRRGTAQPPPGWIVELLDLVDPERTERAPMTAGWRPALARPCSRGPVVGNARTRVRRGRGRGGARGR